MNIERRYGWKKQKADERDFRMRSLSRVRQIPTVLPPSVNLRKWCSEIQDQGELGSCTANAWAGILQFNENKYPNPLGKYYNLSRLFIYYNERVIENTVSDDSGAQLRDGAKAIADFGVCPEYDWPYDIRNFAIKPHAGCYTVAYKNHIHSYYSLDAATQGRTLTNLKTCIAIGQPFVFGFMVYESFETEQMKSTGIMPMPNMQTEEILGGHAVMAVGYNDADKRFLVKNSWGPNWGLKGTNAGYFTMPYDFISDSNMASDFWTVVKEI
jgi:C1A family cysteine protease